MKKLNLIATVLTTFTLASSAFAATSATLQLRGTVPARLSIELISDTPAGTLDLETTQTDLLVAQTREKSNSKTGYKVNISSTNVGELVSEEDASSTIAYTLKYDGNAVDLSGDEFSYAYPTPGNNDRDVEISYTGVDFEDLVEGVYGDDVTFVISAN